MLKLIPALITPEMLAALAAMGHGDEVALVDAHFPAARLASSAVLVRTPGLQTPQLLRAVLTLLPLDDFGPDCAWSMEVVGQPEAQPQAVVEFRQVLAEQDCGLARLERLAFYERARQAQLLVQTGDQRKYANVLLRKGVIAQD
ncbi:MAG: RbsD/FucU family protein [Betaproteobacteria bacterium]